MDQVDCKQSHRAARTRATHRLIEAFRDLTGVPMVAQHVFQRERAGGLQAARRRWTASCAPEWMSWCSATTIIERAPVAAGASAIPAHHGAVEA
jgi:hypothetical protein